MPKEKKVFECEKCGKPFTDWAECDKHESQEHTVMLSWTDFKPFYTPNGLYPSTIEVPFLNGKTVIYSMLETKKEAPIKEGE
jgi:hypothetical protein